MLCFLVDKGFTRLFRSQSQHQSGKAVRLNKRYASVGLVLFVFGIGVFFAGLRDETVLYGICGSILLLTGICLVAYYMTFGVFYDEDSFVVTTFGRKSITHTYGQIIGQQLYMTTGNQVLVELYFAGGGSVQLHGAMPGVYDFLDHAFVAWLRQTGRRREDCAFYDPKNSCWFPKMEE